MAKRKTHVELAIEHLNEKIRALELAKAHLEQLSADKPAKKKTRADVSRVPHVVNQAS